MSATVARAIPVDGGMPLSSVPNPFLRSNIDKVEFVVEKEWFGKSIEFKASIHVKDQSGSFAVHRVKASDFDSLVRNTHAIIEGMP